MTAALVFPFFLGIAHCFDTDHILAVATMNGDARTNTKSLLLSGVSWGIGHSIPVILFGIVYIYSKLFLLENSFINLEVPVGVLLIFMGLIKLFNFKLSGNSTRKNQFLTVGIIHGLAGSAGIILVHLATETNLVFQSIYLILFSIGAILGMGAINILLSRVVAKFDQIKFLNLVTPLLSIGYGVIMIVNYA